MTLKQRLLEGILVGVLGGLVATAIGGIGVLTYNEMKESKNLLEKTSNRTKLLNESSTTSIDRMTVIGDSISSLVERVNKLEEENKILSKVNSSNGNAIKSISKALERATFSNQPEAKSNLKQAEKATSESSRQLKKLPQLTSNREKIRTQQQQQQIQLKGYQNTQQQQQKQQQMW